MKEYRYGNSRVIIHSPLTLLSKDEQKKWFKHEWENNNSILKAIVDVAITCQINNKDEKK